MQAQLPQAPWTTHIDVFSKRQTVQNSFVLLFQAWTHAAICPCMEANDTHSPMNNAWEDDDSWKEVVADQGTVFIQIQLQQRRYLFDTRAS